MELDLNDILNEKLMPASLLFFDAGSDRDRNRSDVIVDRVGFLNNLTDNKYDGTFNNAYSTMGFHRKMIKEYMCSNFLAEQILSDVAPAHFHQRIGIIKSNDENQTSRIPKKFGRSLKSELQESMRFDQGSSGYKDWLSKTSTLDDIFRHYITPSINNASGHNTNSTRRQDKQENEDYEEGDVTGYAMQQPPLSPHGFVPQNHPSEFLENMHHAPGYDENNQQSIAGPIDVDFPHNEDFYNSFQNDNPSNFLLYNPNIHPSDSSPLNNYPPAPPHQPYYSPNYYNSNYHHNEKEEESTFLSNPFKKIKNKIRDLFKGHKKEEYHNMYGGGYDHFGNDDYGAQSFDKGGSSKEMGLKDLFDIALTTLAFLSFGMFILQVLMCVTMTNTNNNNLVMMPMEEINPAVEEVRRRHRRSTDPTNDSTNLPEMNEIAKKILLSIETVLVADKDGGKCLHQILCENNKYSRKRKDNQKIWIPVWSLGLSWLSSKMRTTQSPSSSILESLKASALGLGRANCVKLFPCDFRIPQKDRKNRRTARSINNHIFEWNI